MKKTRKQKLLAQVHRTKQQALQPEIVSSTNSYQLSTNSQKKSGIVFSTPTLETRENGFLVRQDLTHTIVLTLLAICAQLVLWYLLEIRHIKLF